MNTNITSKFLALFLAAWGISVSFAAETKPSESTGIPANAKPAPALVAGEVARAQFTRNIKDLEPVDSISVLPNNITRLIYFTEIRGMTGQTITHRWEFNGKVRLEKKMEIGSVRWRAFSHKTLNPNQLGEWKASVIDANGGTLSVNTFSYVKQPDAEPAADSTLPH